MTAIYTIGHSVHQIDAFLGLLVDAEIAAVADVRSAPYSRRNPQFNRQALSERLESCGVRYVYMGAELGGRGSSESMRNAEGRISYSRIAESAAFREGIERVLTGSERMTIALMCAEKDPLYCHRGILISRHLVALHANVLHIHPGGLVEAHRNAEIRLCSLVGLRELDMFRTEDQILSEAYERQEVRIAHVANRDQAKMIL